MKKSDLAILAAGCFWGVIGLFTRQLSAMGIPSSGILVIRSGGCAVFFAIMILLKDPKLFRVRLRDFGLFFSFGVLSTLFFTYCYYRSIELSSLGVACTLMYCAPAFVMLMSVVFFKEKFTARKGLALLCALAGCFFVSGVLEGDSNLSVLGIVYGLLSGIGYAAYSVLSKVISGRGYDVLTLNFYGWGLCCLGGIAIWGVAPAAPMFASSRNIAVCIGMVLVSGVAPSFLYNWGLRYTEASKGSVMSSVEPVVASLAGFIAFGESPSALGVLGIALVLGAVGILNLKPRVEQTQ